MPVKDQEAFWAGAQTSYNEDLHLKVADALSNWKGAIILVSHDTEFVEQLAPTKVLLLPDGQVDYFSNEWLDLVSLA